ncbi:uncharacterized protein B0H18DRAFT_1056986 [Fomitopsis serialis]|uniref:uncharacterized protein n=1 Tax=Fomitopsis serialis TaxID=139415 RepID=UPI002007F4E0|nr:uncharacterized protein B0H18DRAFT_1056986 [Neoantrodia serialis]KAH9911993.1 hypothetical protein B0H18DRAFT_1056986 [Neoantrodia serialis]
MNEKVTRTTNNRITPGNHNYIPICAIDASDRWSGISCPERALVGCQYHSVPRSFKLTALLQHASSDSCLQPTSACQPTRTNSCLPKQLAKLDWRVQFEEMDQLSCPFIRKTRNPGLASRICEAVAKGHTKQVAIFTLDGDHIPR